MSNHRLRLREHPSAYAIRLGLPLDVVEIIARLDFASLVGARDSGQLVDGDDFNVVSC